jgi:hypothetical protein
VKEKVKKIETILTTIPVIVIVVVFISFFPTKPEVLADPRTYPHYHQYYEPGTPVVPSYPQAPIYLSDEFELTVRIALTDMSWKYSMPDFHVNFAGKEEYVPSSDFYDDGKAKVKFKVDRDEIGSSDYVEYQSIDGRYYNSHTFDTFDKNGLIVNFKIRP